MRKIGFWVLVFSMLMSLRPIVSTIVVAGVNDFTFHSTAKSLSNAGMQNMDLRSGTTSLQPKSWVAVGIAIGLISLGIQLWDISQQHDAEGTVPWIDVQTATIEDDGNGWQVGDRFYVSGDIEFDAGDHRGDTWLSCYLWIRVQLYDQESGKKFLEDEVCKYFAGGGRGSASYEWYLQAANVGGLKARVDAELMGWSITPTTCSPPIYLTDHSWSPVGYIELPYSKSVGVHPDIVKHFQTSTCTVQVTSRTQATLDVTVHLDEYVWTESIEKTESTDPRQLPKRDPDPPHPLEMRTFDFAVKIDVSLTLDNGDKWTDSWRGHPEVYCEAWIMDPLIDTIAWGGIVFSPLIPVEGGNIAFGVEVTSPPPYPIEDIGFYWDFNDTYTAIGQSVSHQYFDEGLYNVTVKAYHGEELLGEEGKYVAVENVPPTIDSFTVTPVANVGENVLFQASVTDPGAYDTLNYTIYFGDGSFVKGVPPIDVSHSYSGFGNYSVAIVVQDFPDFGIEIAQDMVFVIGEYPIADVGGPYQGDETYAIQFDGTDSTDIDGNVVYWVWDFGDGSKGWGSTSTHVYQHEGVYGVTLTVHDDNGLNSTSSAIQVSIDDLLPQIWDIWWYALGRRVYLAGAADIREPGNVLTFNWDFGDGSTGFGRMVQHTYELNDHTYEVTLTVTDEEGHSVQFTKDVVTGPPIHDVAVTDITAYPTSVPQGDPVYIDVTVVNQGDFVETFDVTVYARHWGTGQIIAIGTQTVYNLAPGASEILNFVWDTTGAPLGTYDIIAEAALPEDDDPDDNILIAIGAIGGITVRYQKPQTDLLALILQIATATLILAALGTTAIGLLKILGSPRLRWPKRLLDKGT